VNPSGKTFLSALGNLALIAGSVVLAATTDGASIPLEIGVGAGGYAGASIASGGHWNPLQWNSNAWQGTITGELVGGSAATVGATAFAGPTSTGIFGFSADWSSFGMAMPGRSFSSVTQYRYGFNGKENASEIANGDLAFEARTYDSRLENF
jgi:hypothetical protein